MESNLLSVDVESDGLYGEVFAVGAVVMSPSGNIMETFCGKAGEEAVRSDWVKDNCLPHLSNFPVYADRRALRDAFWAFFESHRDCVVLADVAYPVEAKFFRDCVMDNLSDREFRGPYPLIDLSGMLFALGFDPDIDRRAFSGCQGERHNPLDDAVASGLCAVKLLG